MKHDDRTIDHSELAALYAAGVLPPDEAAVVEERLGAGDRDLADEVTSYEAVFTLLAEGLEPVAPSPRTRERLLEHIAGTRPGQERHAADSGRIEEPHSEIVVNRAMLRNWVDSVIPGIKECLLHYDPIRNVQTKLVRLAPGMTLPAHPHPGVEVCFLVEGDIQTYGMDLRAGDYMLAPPGSHHTKSYTRNGCVFLVISPRHPRTGE